MLVSYSRCKNWYWINQSMVEYITGRCDPRQNEGLLISHSVITISGVLLHLWSMNPFQLRTGNLNDIHPPFFIMCSNSDSKVFDRCSPSYTSMTLEIIEAIWHDISRNPTGTISNMKVSTTRDITHTLYVYHLGTSFNWRPVRWAATVIGFYWSCCPNIFILLRINAPVKDHYQPNHPITSWWWLCRHTAS